MSKLILTIEQKNVLDKLTRKNKMDCWFWIDDRRECIIDLENNSIVIDTRTAILEINDGTPDVSDFLNADEARIFEALVRKCLIG